MTQIQLAKKLDITQGDLSKMESGKRSVGKQLARRLATVFGTDYRVFL
jgi:transcriptional regulator with XRE-family HTH domain